jgi:hypothetical protein
MTLFYNKSKPIPIPIIKEDIKIKKVNILIIWNNKILLSLNNNDNYEKGNICIPNGFLLFKENEYNAAKRIVSEYTGINIYESQLKLIYKYIESSYYYIILDNKYNEFDKFNNPIVKGPFNYFQNKLIQSNQLAKDFNCSMIIKKNGINSGLAWCNINDIINCDLPYVNESSIIKTICYFSIEEEFFL